MAAAPSIQRGQTAPSPLGLQKPLMLSAPLTKPFLGGTMGPFVLQTGGCLQWQQDMWGGEQALGDPSGAPGRFQAQGGGSCSSSFSLSGGFSHSTKPNWNRWGGAAPIFDLFLNNSTCTADSSLKGTAPHKVQQDMRQAAFLYGLAMLAGAAPFTPGAQPRPLHRHLQPCQEPTGTCGPLRSI